MIPKDRLIVTSGDYDILKVEDLRFLEKCRAQGDWLIIGLSSDTATHMKTGTLNNSYDDRQELLQGLKCVDEVIRYNDADGTDCNLLKSVKLFYPQSVITYVSKHDMHNMPETKIRGITFQVID